MSDPKTLLQPGDVIDDQVVVRLIGQGGYGEVHEVAGPDGERRALKVTKIREQRDKKVFHRFLGEAHALTKIDSPHVVRCEGFGVTPAGFLYLLLELVEGASLRKVLQRGPLPVDRAMRIYRQMLRGLHDAHCSGVVHRDIKPDNVMLGPNSFVKILDFGICKLDDVSMHTSTLVATPAYAAPDYLNNEDQESIDVRWDLYSAAIVTYELIAGRSPFLREDGKFPPVAQLIALICQAAIPPLQQLRPDCPAFVSEVIHRGLEREPDRRYPTAATNEHAVIDACNRMNEVDTTAFLNAGTDEVGLRPRKQKLRVEVGERSPVPQAVTPPPAAAPAARALGPGGTFQMAIPEEALAFAAEQKARIAEAARAAEPRVVVAPTAPFDRAGLPAEHPARTMPSAGAKAAPAQAALAPRRELPEILRFDGIDLILMVVFASLGGAVMWLW